jgi:hypothetical protein
VGERRGGGSMFPEKRGRTVGGEGADRWALGAREREGELQEGFPGYCWAGLASGRPSAGFFFCSASFFYFLFPVFKSLCCLKIVKLI